MHVDSYVWRDSEITLSIYIYAYIGKTAQCQERNLSGRLRSEYEAVNNFESGYVIVPGLFNQLAGLKNWQAKLHKPASGAPYKLRKS